MSYGPPTLIDVRTGKPVEPHGALPTTCAQCAGRLGHTVEAPRVPEVADLRCHECHRTVGAALRIVATTLVGVGRVAETAHAVATALGIVDEHIIIDTAPPHADPITVDAPCLVTMIQWAWRDDFSKAVNASLDFAADTGADWGMRIDSDERVICPDPAALRAFLGTIPAHVIVALAHAADGSHTRERFFRLPARSKFVGRTHEMFVATEDQQAIVPREIVAWTELPKTREQLRAKFRRDVEMLQRDLDDDANNGAAYHYLGITLQSLAAFAREDGDEDGASIKLVDAIDCYRKHRRLDTTGAPAWHEGTAWSCYRAAECYMALKQPDRALDAVAAGLVLDAGIGELYWIGAVASLQVGRPEQARAWAMSAKAHGMGSASERRRRGFRVPRGLTTGPDEVLALAAAKL